MSQIKKEEPKSSGTLKSTNTNKISFVNRHFDTIQKERGYIISVSLTFSCYYLLGFCLLIYLFWMISLASNCRFSYKLFRRIVRGSLFTLVICLCLFL